nr:immunoglobulin heavy chain junction region [Macaca mulatta]MOX61069.1 immunoglobulin heavy chain junction region [Macaca mulatta]MOX61909.1 immunoglobulin heavy chain junction region [Macaca mulatta]MOX62241.1 immunoglobulin heavy chain junction region [Macaca mulatta]MOX65124.1 immunoglobulin heavy chain junction region [Macaca mulatta]
CATGKRQLDLDYW